MNFKKVDFNVYSKAYYEMDKETYHNQRPEFIQANLHTSHKEHDYFVWDEQGQVKAVVTVERARAYRILYIAEVLFGPILDYQDEDLFHAVLSDITNYYKKQFKCIGIKINPPYAVVHFDDVSNPQETEYGKDNDIILKDLGYERYPYQYYERIDLNLQIDALYQKDIEGISYEEWLKDLKAKVRSQIRRTVKDGVVIRWARFEDMDAMRAMDEETSARTGEVTHPLERFYRMQEIQENSLAFPFAYLDTQLAQDNLHKENDQSQQEIAKLDKKFADRPNSKKYVNQVRELTESIERNEAKIQEMIELQEEHGEQIPLGFSVYFIGNKRLVHFAAGIDYSQRRYNAMMAIHNFMFQWATENNFKTYDFLGVRRSETEEEADRNDAVIDFKRNFDGDMVYLTGNWYQGFNPLFNRFKD